MKLTKNKTDTERVSLSTGEDSVKKMLEEQRLKANEYQKQNRASNTKKYAASKKELDVIATNNPDDKAQDKALTEYIELHKDDYVLPRVGANAIAVNALELAIVRRAVLRSESRSVRDLFMSLIKDAGLSD